MSRRLRTGFRGELEFIRRTADIDSFNVFHAAPDTELAEYAVYDVDAQTTIGIQIKCGTPGAGRGDIAVTFPVHTFSPAPNVVAVVFAQPRDGIELAPDCLLIPSADIPRISAQTDGHYHLRFRPGPGAPTVVDPYRIAVSNLAPRLHSYLQELPD